MEGENNKIRGESRRREEPNSRRIGKEGRTCT